MNIFFTGKNQTRFKKMRLKWQKSSSLTRTSAKTVLRSRPAGAVGATDGNCLQRHPNTKRITWRFPESQRYIQIIPFFSRISIINHPFWIPPGYGNPHKIQTIFSLLRVPPGAHDDSERHPGRSRLKKNWGDPREKSSCKVVTAKTWESIHLSNGSQSF